ncbi:MAG TPA: chemotaxis protein CheX [Candidatus Baltobacteraceae bacterium]
MSEDDLKVFIKGTEHFFAQVATSPAEVSTPFVKESTDRVIYDFSAVIGISGTQRGCVYYTAPRDMVRDLVSQLGEPEQSDEIFADYVGEIANTISGNAREHLGTGFMISVPVVFCEADNVRFPSDAPAFVIPIMWNGYRSSLILCLKDDEPSPVPIGVS